MTYEELVAQVREVFGKADAGRIEGHVAYQFNITGEAEGAFYLEINEGELHVEPYEYYDRDVLFTTTADTLIKIGLGELDALWAVTTGKLKFEGSVDKALLLKELSASIKESMKTSESDEQAKDEAKAEVEPAAEATAEVKVEKAPEVKTNGKKWPNRKKKRR